MCVEFKKRRDYIYEREEAIPGISALKPEGAFYLFVDVSGLEEGVYTLPVQIHIDNAPEFTCALSSPQVTVTLQAKP